MCVVCLPSSLHAWVPDQLSQVIQYAYVAAAGFMCFPKWQLFYLVLVTGLGKQLHNTSHA